MLGVKKLIVVVVTLMLSGPVMAYEVGDCTERGKRVQGFYDEIPDASVEYQWYERGQFERTVSTIDRICIDVENNSTRPIRVIKWVGKQTNQTIEFRGWNIAPNTSKTICEDRLGSKILTNKSARIWFYEYGYRQGECLNYYTEEDKERGLIYDGCMTSKSKGASSASIPYIRKECRNISKDPNFFHKWRWGS